MERSVFEIVKAPLGWSVFADNIKIGGVYESRSAALEAAAQAASDTITDGGAPHQADARRQPLGDAVRRREIKGRA